MKTKNNLKYGLMIDMIGALSIAIYFAVYLVYNSVDLLKSSTILLVSFSALFYSIYSCKNLFKIRKERVA